MEAIAREAMTGLLNDVSAISRTDEAFTSVAETMQEIITVLGNELPQIIRVAGQQAGSTQPVQPHLVSTEP